MKNIITTAALLTAGTLAMNAEMVGWDLLDGGKSLTASGTSLQSWNISEANISLAGTGIWSLAFTVSKDSFISGTALTLLAVDTANNGSVKNYFSGLFGAGYAYDADGADKPYYTSYNKQIWTLPDTVSSFTAVQESLTFVFYSNSEENLNFSLYGDNNFDSALYQGSVPSFKYSNTIIDTLNFGGTNSAYTQGSKFNSNESVGSFTLLGAVYSASSVATAADLTSYYNTQVVPEPSAFGLLAGLGALALVGARRRRR